METLFILTKTKFSTTNVINVNVLDGLSIHLNDFLLPLKMHYYKYKTLLK